MSYETLTVLLILVGETLSIAAELIASKLSAQHYASDTSIFVPMFFLIALGGALLVAGYMMGQSQLGNIWIIAAISMSSILIVEPIMALLLLHQFPTFGAGVGFAFGVLGSIAALFLK